MNFYIIRHELTGDYFCLRRNGETPTPFLYSNLKMAEVALKRRRFLTREEPITSQARKHFRIVPVEIVERAA